MPSSPPHFHLVLGCDFVIFCMPHYSLFLTGLCWNDLLLESELLFYFRILRLSATAQNSHLEFLSAVFQQLKNPPASAGDTGTAGSIPVLGRSPGGRNGTPFLAVEYSCLENPIDRGAWWVTIHSVAQSLALHTVEHD